MEMLQKIQDSIGGVGTLFNLPSTATAKRQCPE